MALAFAFNPGLAVAKPAPVSIGPGAPVVSDGTRFAAAPLEPGRVRVFDDRRGTWWDLEQPDGCGGDGQYPSGGAATIGGGVLVWNCEGSTYGWNRPRLVALGTGAPLAADTAAVDDPGLSDAGEYSTRAVGSEWLAGTVVGYHWYRNTFVNWHTGAVRYDEPKARRSYADLNSAHLTGKLCSPLRQPANPEYDFYATETTPRYLPFEFRRPRAVWKSRRGLVLGHCGQRGGPLLLSDCDGHGANQTYGCLTPQIGGGLVTWSLGTAVHAYVISTRGRYAWRIPRTSVNDAPLVTHTRHAIYVSGSRPANGRYVIRGAF